MVVWYGLSQGITDNILKDVGGNIQGYSFDSSSTDKFIKEVIKDFFQEYDDVRLPNGAFTKIAIYFPQNEDLKELRPVVESALIEIGLSPSIVLRNTSESSKDEIDAFNRLNDPTSPHRVILLVNKGTEGWNCPSLFSCALARKLKSSNNFVLQAATRCLRQIPGNIRSARTVFKKEGAEELPLSFKKPSLKSRHMTKAAFTLAGQQATRSVLQQLGDTVDIKTDETTVDSYSAANELAQIYRLDIWKIRDELVRLYGGNEIPLAHINDLCRQIEEQTRFYEVKEEKIDIALALVKPDGFQKQKNTDGTEIYIAEIIYFKDREKLLLNVGDLKDNEKDFGFHYTPYNFNSTPKNLFLSRCLNI